MKIPWRFGACCALLGVAVTAQDPLAEIRRSIDVGDSRAAVEAWGELLRAPASRAAIAGTGEALLSESGFADAASDVLKRRIAADGAKDPVLHYALAVSLRRQRRLAEADEALARAVALDDVSGVPRTLWAWNAVQRFDPDSARARAAPLSGTEADAIRAAADAMTPPSRAWPRLAAMLAACALVAIGIAWLMRVRSRDS